MSSRSIVCVFVVFLCLQFFAPEFAQIAFAQIDLGGKSMMKDLPFIADMASTAQDILFISSKVIGAGLAFVGVKNAGQRNWDHAIPAFVGGAGLFFLPQIVSALSKIGGQ